jgi:Uma2 family endonuclease
MENAPSLPSPSAEPSIMGMPHAAERWTAERVRTLPDDGNRYELISGELVVTPAPRGRHQEAVMSLVRRLDPWLQATTAGRLLMSPADISLGEDEVLQPDLFVYRTATGGALRDWADIEALLLVIEVSSPSTARCDRTLKRRRYQRARVPEYWVVDLDARLIERWRPEDERPEILSEWIEWTGLAINLAALFAEIHGE